MVSLFSFFYTTGTVTAVFSVVFLPENRTVFMYCLKNKKHQDRGFTCVLPSTYNDTKSISPSKCHSKVTPFVSESSKRSQIFLQLRYHLILLSSRGHIIWVFNSALCFLLFVCLFSIDRGLLHFYFFFPVGNWMGIRSYWGLKAIKRQCWAWCIEPYWKHYSQNIWEQQSCSS